MGKHALVTIISVRSKGHPTSLAQNFRMSPVLVIALFLCVLGRTHAVYKKWVPNTNFENGTNWDKGTVPCSSDRIQFLPQKEVSVYVETIHSIHEMNLPVDGEFILPQGAGFSASNGQNDDCGPGSEVTFKDTELLHWFDPAQWQAASSWDNLEKGSFLFSVHEQSVPCPQDDVVFWADSSFRVDTTANQLSVPVKSVSVLGKRFSSSDDFAQYLSSHSGQLQFHGASKVHVGEPGCGDKMGCVCDNSANHDRICSAVKCAPTDCKKPLRAAGHCCNVCGAIVHLRCKVGFDLSTYQQRLHHLFLIQPPYQSIQLAISRLSTVWPLRLVSREVVAEIQVLILEGETGAESGRVAESLARDILRDVSSQGTHLGIEGADFQASSGGSSTEGTSSNAGAVAGGVVGFLLLVACLLLLAVLIHRGIIKTPSLLSLSSCKKGSEIGELGGPLDHGFDNPMFDKPTLMPAEPELYIRETGGSIVVTNAGIHFVNPIYDETDFAT